MAWYLIELQVIKLSSLVKQRSGLSVFLFFTFVSTMFVLCTFIIQFCFLFLPHDSLFIPLDFFSLLFL